MPAESRVSYDDDAMRSLPPECEQLLDRSLTAVVCTVNPTGGPQASVVWFERRGNTIVLFAKPTALKVRNLRHDPRVELIIVDDSRERGPGVPLYLRIIGVASIEAAERHLPDRLAIRYGNPDGYPNSDRDFVAIHITLTRIGGYGPYPGAPLGGWLQAASP